MGLSGLKTRGTSKGLDKFVRWCLARFMDRLDPQSARTVKRLLAGWNFTVRFVPRRLKLWEEYALRVGGGRRTRGVTRLPAPGHRYYAQRRLDIVIGPEVLLNPPMLGYILMHEVGHALRYAEFQFLAKKMGLPPGMMLREEENEEDAEGTARMFVEGVQEAASNKGMDPVEFVNETFQQIVSGDPVLARVLARVNFQFRGPTSGP